MKLLTIIGARPQFIKAAPISKAIKKTPSINEVTVHTGQHYDPNMSDIFFSQMSLPTPNYRLELGNLSHGKMTGRMLIELEEIMLKEKPDYILIYGDTNSTLAGALAASKLQIPIAHIEAGLRSFNRSMPEEINRIIADELSTQLFCPTDTAVKNLKKESVTGHIHQIGDVMYDAFQLFQQFATPSKTIKELTTSLSSFFLCTIHRQENTDNPDRLKSITEALEQIAEKHHIILPLHPRTQKLLANHGLTLNNITQIEPVGYLDMLHLLKNCLGVFTDSGGLQKEAYFSKKPLVILRDETEWVELINNKIAHLTGANKEKIIQTSNWLSQPHSFPNNLYGDGKAADKIISILTNK